MKVLINYADHKFRKQQKWNSLSGKILGGFDKIIEYSPESLDEEFKNENKEIINTPKGSGLWLWKPYIIKDALSKIKNGDYLFYCDSGAIFIKSINPLIKYLEINNQDILCFNFPLIEKQWTKRDAFILLDCDSEEYFNTPQIIGGYILIKKSKKSIEFIDEFIQLSMDVRLISDNPNVLGFENYPEFITHRHDQSIFSLLCKKKAILIARDISDYGVFPAQHIHNGKYLYDEKLLNISSNKFKGTLLANRSINPLIYLIKYLTKCLILISRKYLNFKMYV